MSTIKFIQEDPSTPIKYRDVPAHQFFVSGECLYQKMQDGHTNQITNSDGEPYCVPVSFLDHDKIDRIIPRIKKIEY